jgi:predicted glycosyltransferase
MSVEDGVAKETRVSECDLTEKELYIVMTTLKWACEYANEDSVKEIAPIIDKLKTVAGLKVGN